MPPPPQVMERSGWIPGLVLLLLMSLANAFSVEVVFRLCRLTGRPTSLGEIGDKAPPLRTRPLFRPCVEVERLTLPVLP